MFGQYLAKILLFSATWINICSLSPLLAQIIPDDTLNDQSSLVTPNVTVKEQLIDSIEGGAIRDSNLFHSFEEFNIDNGQQVYFANPEGIINILTRVTGNNASQILGTLGVDGNANLFLLNPNGIVFGENAALDINGSFLATTAESYLFNNDLQYSAIDPQLPPLLTINIPIGLQMGNNPAAIQIRGTGHNLDINPFTFTPTRNQSGQGLQISSNNTFALIGGEINLTGASIIAPEGRIELGSLLDEAIVEIIAVDDGLTFNYPQIEAFNNINLTQAASLEVSGDNNGNIRLQGNNIGLSDNSVILANNLDLGNGGNIELQANSASLNSGSSISANTIGLGNAGNINFNLTGNLIVDGDNEFGISYINSQVGILTSNGNLIEGTGNGGDINIVADSVNVANGGEILAITTGEGDTGDINLNLDRTLIIDGRNTSNSRNIFNTSNRILSGVGAFDVSGNPVVGKGNGGSINITADSVRLINGGGVNGNTFGDGNAANIDLNVINNLLIENPNGVVFSGISSQSGRLDFDGNPISATGNGGSIDIAANSVRLTDGGLISASTVGGEGNAGDINLIITEDLDINGDNNFGSSGIISQLGGVDRNGNFIDSGGNGGKIDIAANSVKLTSGGLISTATGGEGDAGNISLNIADSLVIDGIGNLSLSSIFSNVGGLDGNGKAITTARGDGGDIDIAVNSVKLTNGGSISASVGGEGNTGNINLTVTDFLEIDGQSFFSPSAIFVDVGAVDVDGNSIDAKGNSGKIEIVANSVKLTNGGLISASTAGEGNAGNINLTVTDFLEIDGQNSLGFSAIASQVGAIDLDGNAVDTEGNGGEIEIVANSVKLTNGGGISTATAGDGDAGNINLTVTDSLEIDGQNSFSLSGISSEVIGREFNGNFVAGKGNGGEIEIMANSVNLTNNGRISASTGGEGNSGNIKIDSNAIALSNFTIETTSSSDFNAGSIFLNTQQLDLLDNATISVSSLSTGNAGNININSDRVNLNNTSSLQAQVAAGQQGNINLATKQIVLNNDSNISTNATATATGGNIFIENTDNLVLLENSQIIAQAVSGNGGNIQITTTGLFQSVDSVISASSQFGLDGNVELAIFNNDPIRGLEKLPITLSDRESQITTGCPTQEEANFIVTGKGGLPEDPSQELTESVYSSILELPSVNSSRQFDRDRPKQQTRVDSPIVEALSWHINARGNVELISGTSIANNQNDRVYCDRF